jgi:hypothetical protein
MRMRMRMPTQRCGRPSAVFGTRYKVGKNTRQKKFFAAKGKKGVGEKLDVNSMNWPKNGLKCLGFSVRSF